MRQALFIVNPAAGAGRALPRWESLARTLAGRRVPHRPHLTQHPGEALAVARAHSHSHDPIVAVGGDGTIHEVATGLLLSGHPHPRLGILPVGTGNDIARAAGIADACAALEAILEGHAAPFDTIQVDYRDNGTPQVRHALLFASVGITGDLLRHTTPTLKRFLGRRWAYRLALLRALWTYHPPEIHASWNLQPTTHNPQPPRPSGPVPSTPLVSGRFLFIGASNTETAGGGMRLAPGARPDDGQFNVNLIDALPRVAATRQLRRLVRGTHTTHPGVRYFPACRLELDARAPVELQIDGEIIGHTPARFTIRPAALHILGVSP